MSIEVDTGRNCHVRLISEIAVAIAVKTNPLTLLVAGLLALAAAPSFAQPVSVGARIEIEPIETLKMGDFDPIDPSSAPVVFRTFVTTSNRSLLLRIEVDVESGRFGFLGRASLDLGRVPARTTVSHTNREFDEYDLDEASDELLDIATERGLLPPDDYFFTMRVIDLETGEPVGTDRGVITTTNSGLQIDLVGPGTTLDQDPDIVSTQYPIFQWFSGASSYNFALYEVRPGQATAEDIVSALPVFEQTSVSPGTYVYPNAAEELVEGKVYAWQIEAISLTSSGQERFPSEVLWFTVEGIQNPLTEDDVRTQNYARMRIEPEESQVAPGGSVILRPTIFDADDVPVFGAPVRWTVIPASGGSIDGDGVFVAGDNPGVVAVVATIGKLEQFATVVIGDSRSSEPVDDEASSEPSILVLSPADGQLVMESAPTFAWVYTSADSSASAFRLALREGRKDAGDYESAALLWEAEVPVSQSSVTYPPNQEPLDSGSTYFVRVTAIDSTGEALLRSPVASFETQFEDKLSYELQRAWEEALLDGVDSTEVRLLLKTDGIASTSLINAIEEAGAIIELVEGPWVQILVPFFQLNRLAAIELVELVALPSPHEYLAAPGIALGETTFDGPISRPDFGDPSKYAPTNVAVFEFGFDPAVIKEMLPDVDVRYHSFREDKRIEGSGGADSRHGSAVVRALAEYLPPNTTLHLVNFDTEPEFQHALDHAVHQLGVNVITCSVSWANAYDHYDGTSYFSRRVEQILASKTPLVVAAGNFALSHWQADFADSDGDDVHNFDPSAAFLEVKLNNARFYNFLMSWNDWGGDPRVDLDIEIYNAAGELLLDRRGRPYASRSVQGPSEYAEPVERIRGFKPLYPGTRSYYVKVLRKRNTPDPATRNTNFELYVSPPPDESVPGPVARSSLAAGIATTDSPSVIPIGANDLSHSSQGPTNDGRVRPDFSADGVVEMDGVRIRGTSFATPRVAAIMSLIFATHPDWGVDEAYDFLRRFAVQPDGTPGKNDHFGWGQLDLDAVIEALTS